MPRISTALSSITLMVFLLSNVSAQAPEPASAPGPGSSEVDCMTYLVNMADCLTYVEAGSNLTKPDKPCCGELKQLVNTQPLCLCELLSNSTKSIGLEIDISRALKLETLCKIDAPSISLCSVVGYPVAGVPSSSPPMSPGISPMSSGMSPVGVAPSSETEKGVNGATWIRFSKPLFLVCLGIALDFHAFFFF